MLVRFVKYLTSIAQQKQVSRNVISVKIGQVTNLHIHVHIKDIGVNESYHTTWICIRSRLVVHDDKKNHRDDQNSTKTHPLDELSLTLTKTKRLNF